MKNGFTLTELLAVIAILGVIMIIAIPSYNNIANEIKKSNLESMKSMITAATIDYANKHDIDAIKPATQKCNGTTNNCCKYYSINAIAQNGIFQTTNGKITNPTTGSELQGYIKVYYDTSKYVLNGTYETSITNNNCFAGSLE